MTRLALGLRVSPLTAWANVLKFIAAAKEVGADETGKTFLASFKAIAKHKTKKP